MRTHTAILSLAALVFVLIAGVRAAGPTPVAQSGQHDHDATTQTAAPSGHMMMKDRMMADMKWTPH